MRRRASKIGLFLLAIGVGVGIAMSAPASSKVHSQRQASDETGITVSGPYTHKNLTIFLLHGADPSQGRAPLSLQEAMRRKLVRVRETGDVNKLTIQNLSGQEVFVQAGDIVKGGQQDRALALDLIAPPKSGRIPIDAFCVEHGRWSRRGNEAVTAFSASNNMLASKGLKIAAKASASQGDVWENVSKEQHKLAMNVTAPPAAMLAASRGRRGSGPGAGPVDAPRTREISESARRLGDDEVNVVASNGRTLAARQGLTTVTSAASPSSLQLTLENKLVKESASEYVKALTSRIGHRRDVIGFVFAINGQINSGDVYSSNALFLKLWPKMLEASAVEAVAELKADEAFDPVTKEAAQAFLLAAQDGKAETKNVTARTSVVMRETEKRLFFETRDRARNGSWVHRNYLSK